MLLKNNKKFTKIDMFGVIKQMSINFKAFKPWKVQYVLWL